MSSLTLNQIVITLIVSICFSNYAYSTINHDNFFNHRRRPLTALSRCENSSSLSRRIPKSLVRLDDIQNIDDFLNPKDGIRAAFARHEQLRWPGGIVPYEMSGVNSLTEQKINEAVEYINQVSCVQWVKRGPEHYDYVVFSPHDMSSSMVGRIGGKQDIFIQRDGSEYLGVYLHEMMHALGFFHLMNRYDRDQYLDIFWENVADEAKREFEIVPRNHYDILADFDYDSIMLYGSYAGAKEPGKIVMEAKSGSRIIKEINDKTLSDSDIQALSKAYCGFKKHRANKLQWRWSRYPSLGRT